MFDLDNPCNDFEMKFYILVDSENDWPVIESTIVLECSLENISNLLSNKINDMDILLICIEIKNIPIYFYEKLNTKFRITFRIDPHLNLKSTQQAIADLCWASMHSKTFDIVDAYDAFGGADSIVALDNKKENSKISCEFSNAIIFVSATSNMTDQGVVKYYDEVCERIGGDRVYCLILSKSHIGISNYTVLVGIKKLNRMECR